MSDWQGVAFQRLGLSTFDSHSGGGAADVCASRPSFNTSAVWPAANRAIYVPVVVEQPVTAYQVAIEVVTQSGNLDVGIYDELGNRLVSKGSTAVAAAGIQLIDITDTALLPGVVFLAMCCDNTTASFKSSNVPSALELEICGVQQQAVGAVTLPDPATFANPASAYVPAIFVSTQLATA